ncbi:hypothetical protein PS639_00520 [Pseudomonas fluorescens]|nr:hypothetical protein PS639_00520 [Pseudomonas fluorescens]
MAGEAVTDFQRGGRVDGLLREAQPLSNEYRFAGFEPWRLRCREVQWLALGAQFDGGLAGCGADGECRDVEAPGQVRCDQVAIAQAVEGLAVQGLVHVFGVAVGGQDQCARQLQVGQGGGAGEPGVGEDIELQFEEATDHGGGAGLQAGLDSQFGFCGEDADAYQADEQSAESCGE